MRRYVYKNTRKTMVDWHSPLHKSGHYKQVWVQYYGMVWYRSVTPSYGMLWECNTMVWYGMRVQHGITIPWYNILIMKTLTRLWIGQIHSASINWTKYYDNEDFGQTL